MEKNTFTELKLAFLDGRSEGINIAYLGRSEKPGSSMSTDAAKVMFRRGIADYLINDAINIKLEKPQSIFQYDSFDDAKMWAIQVGLQYASGSYVSGSIVKNKFTNRINKLCNENEKQKIIDYEKNYLKSQNPLRERIYNPY